MDMIWLQEWAGEAGAVALAGLLVGAVFGWAAQRSRFCMRASVVEVARGSLGPRLSVWLLTFATALFWTQALVAADLTGLAETRYLARPGSWSGAVIGGLMFGIGMVMARGCSGRLLVLSATGNLRALLSGLVFAVVAQMSLSGILAPVREQLTTLGLTDGPNPDLLATIGLGGTGPAMALAVAATAVALTVALRNKVGPSALIYGSAVGFAVALGWALTGWLAASAFDPSPVESITFSGPSAGMLMFMLERGATLDFDVGLVPGVAVGAFIAALVHRDLAWQGWEGARAMQRYLAGAALMGFGAMLAGGCAIGAGVTGGSTLAATMWTALAAMWLGGMLTDALLDRPRGAVSGPAPDPQVPKPHSA